MQSLDLFHPRLFVFARMNNLPRDPTKFSSDPRIRYSEERQTHILASGSPECFYDKGQKRWTTPSDPECDEFLKKQAEELPKKRRSPAEEVSLLHTILPTLP
ncbi:hypothetical protein P154DRAFT_526955 [Amniculicola lignicola CBS 123094]|uniref:Uncharacterized protein n=1 Tax=Amniculicola lignicola CBS 123094 TaxID=1392246 RepID=A0A6A5VXZ9_9PLEO|nr:hypothetical protein P154DRAFT_526955 [Amniculicola lignicola CBS 123094]